MSLHRYVVVTCNECGVAVEFDSWHSTAAASRTEARLQDWQVGLPGSVDYCPAHRTTGAR